MKESAVGAVRARRRPAMRRHLLALLCLWVCLLSAGCSQDAASAVSDTQEPPSSSEESQPSPSTGEKALTPDEISLLDAAREAYASMTPEEQALARSQERVWCPNFDHLDWETRIEVSLIRYVGEEEFASWSDGRWDRGLCTSIYDLARDFSISYPEMEELIRSNGLEELYPLQRVKARFEALGLTAD